MLGRYARITRSPLYFGVFTLLFLIAQALP